MLLYRFTDEQLFEFLQYCFSYEDPDLRLRALKLEHRSAQQFAEEQTGENIFQQMKQSLSLYAQAHCNQNVQIEAGGESFTDGIRIYLPAVLHNDHPEREYRLLTALNVGYIEFGTLDVDLRTTSGNWVYPQKDELEIERMFRSFQNSNLAKEIFLLFEDQRIRLCVGREYPGIAPLLSIHKKNIKTSISSSKKRSVVEEYIALLSEWLEYGTIPYKHKENIVSFDTTILTTGTVDASILLLQQAYSYAYALLQKSSAYQPQKREKGTLNTKKMHTEDRKKRISFERKKAKSNPEEPIPFDFREASEFMERMPGPAGPQKEKEEPIHPVLTKNT
jgi:hypothetical protein